MQAESGSSVRTTLQRLAKHAIVCCLLGTLTAGTFKRLYKLFWQRKRIYPALQINSQVIHTMGYLELHEVALSYNGLHQVTFGINPTQLINPLVALLQAPFNPLF